MAPACCSRFRARSTRSCACARSSVQQQSVITLAVPAPGLSGDDYARPGAVGYALTGDQNIVHVGMIARYRVRDPAEWAFYGPDAEKILRTEVSAAMVRSVGEIGVDRVLAEERKDLTKTTRRARQAGLDAAHAGLELVALELTRLSPPIALRQDFNAVQTAFIGAETDRRTRRRSRSQVVVPGAHATADRAVEWREADAARSSHARAAMAPRSRRSSASIAPIRRGARAALPRRRREAPSAAPGPCAGFRRPTAHAIKRLRIQSPPTAAGTVGDAGAAAPDSSTAVPRGTDD